MDKEKYVLGGMHRKEMARYVSQQFRNAKLRSFLIFGTLIVWMADMK